jgi:hypothetical protein
MVVKNDLELPSHLGQPNKAYRWPFVPCLTNHDPSDSASSASLTRARASQYHTPSVPTAIYFPCLAICDIGLVPDTLADLGIKGVSPFADTGDILLRVVYRTLPA